MIDGEVDLAESGYDLAGAGGLGWRRGSGGEGSERPEQVGAQLDTGLPPSKDAPLVSSPWIIAAWGSPVDSPSGFQVHLASVAGGERLRSWAPRSGQRPA